ncbi:hypothetical protein CIB84_011735 [Bambusicola thoracicus]|uniref:Uncharacterized protein n=1 Tax=Bambusicola thoracicus TaxID=9083 RepID=A0A2P4SK83_BAMTH|nr:hypothetical protein CIB84_011735 [Bambusicola thoracicus]
MSVNVELKEPVGFMTTKEWHIF